MKTILTTLLTAFLSCTALAVTLPDGFVYRAKCERSSSGEPPTKIDVTLRLYVAEKSDTPSWTGVFRDTPLTNGLFQIWVSEAAHDASVSGEESLAQVLWKGAANWIGVSFGDGRECKPRRMLVTTPLAKSAVAAEALDSTATVHDLVDCDTLAAENVRLGHLVCGTLQFGDVKDLRFNVSEMNVRSAALSRDKDNAILVRTAGDWTEPVRLSPGSAITNTLGKAAFLTLRSTDTAAVPLLSVPVPSGEVFVWQAEPVTCTWRFTPIGAE